MWGESLVGFSQIADIDARHGFGDLSGKKSRNFFRGESAKIVNLLGFRQLVNNSGG